jgi:glutathione S-transferase
MQEGRAAMSELTIWTLDWVPEGPRGFVRDLRLRWACEEAGLNYTVRTVPFDGRETNHLADQPFGQVPFLKDDGVQWTIAALNSIEMVTVPWWFLKLCGDANNGLTGWMGQRLDHLERVLSGQEWLAARRFTVADLLMADVLRVSDVRAFGNRPATEAYVTRVTSRTAFKKAQADQIGHFEAADQKRAGERSN